MSEQPTYPGPARGSAYPTPTVDQPSFEELEAMAYDMEDMTATDGCSIEPDGVCYHGHPSWFLALGLI